MEKVESKPKITNRHLHCISIMIEHNFNNGSIEDMDWSIDCTTEITRVVDEIREGNLEGSGWKLYYSLREFDK